MHATYKQRGSFKANVNRKQTYTQKELEFMIHITLGKSFGSLNPHRTYLMEARQRETF